MRERKRRKREMYTSSRVYIERVLEQRYDDEEVRKERSKKLLKFTVWWWYSPFPTKSSSPLASSELWGKIFKLFSSESISITMGASVWWSEQIKCSINSRKCNKLSSIRLSSLADRSWLNALSLLCFAVVVVDVAAGTIFSVVCVSLCRLLKTGCRYSGSCRSSSSSSLLNVFVLINCSTFTHCRTAYYRNVVYIAKEMKKKESTCGITSFCLFWCTHHHQYQLTDKSPHFFFSDYAHLNHPVLRNELLRWQFAYVAESIFWVL